MDGLFYITPESNSLRSASSPLFTNLFKLFYHHNGKKTIPSSVLRYCNLPEFIAVLYMDDGSLSITHRVNHRNKKIYLTPQIYLYLQNYTKEDLTLLITSSSKRWKNYSTDEIDKLILLKKNGNTDKNIAETLDRSYWSIIY